MEKRMDIGSRLKSLRESRGLTLEQVGAYIGVNKATVQRYEIGNIDIKRNIAIKLAECLGTSPSYIMGWTNDPSVEITEKMPTPIPERRHSVNVVKIAGRDGSYVEKRLTDDQVKALRAIVDQFPDASDDL